MFDYEETKEDAICSFEQQIKQLVKDAFDKGYQCGYADCRAMNDIPYHYESQVVEVVEKCDRPLMDCENCWKELHCEAKDRPQIDCSWK